MCQNTVSSKEIIRYPGKLNCLWLDCLAEQLTIAFSKRSFKFILWKKFLLWKWPQYIFTWCSFYRKKKIVIEKYFRFTKLEGDFLKFQFVIFKAVGVEYSNQIRLCFTVTKALLLLKFQDPAMLEQLIFGSDSRFGKLGLFQKKPRCPEPGIYSRPCILGLVAANFKCMLQAVVACVCYLSSVQVGERLSRFIGQCC